MYLAELKVEGFRKLGRLELRFRPGLNVFVGPNNIGKTAIVDALRALLSTTDDGALRIDQYDLHIDASGAKAQRICFQYVFRELSDEEQADFMSALRPRCDPASQVIEYEAHLAVEYSMIDGGTRLRPKRWCGMHEENQVTSDMLEDLRAVYLPPLRDPANGLRPSRSSQLARLAQRLSNDEARLSVVEVLKRFDDELSIQEPVAGAQREVASRHGDMLGDLLKQTLRVGFTPPDFQRITARLSLAVEDLDVEQNGLGYNNLIYMAVVLSELSSNPDAAYKALIVEEPEAHLHPQLQAVLLHYLQSKGALGPEKNPVQVFVTSHSPNFASIAHIDSVACIHESQGIVKAFFPREAIFEKTKKEKLQRYLDVTRAELFFARRIILVEGAAELFMITALAKKIEVDLRRQSVSVLSTEGLNFDAFFPLFGEDALNVRVAIVSDADPPAGRYPALGDAAELSRAAESIQQRASDYVRPFFALKTFEYDLALFPANQPIMLTALAELHPTIAIQLREAVDKASDVDKAKVLFSGMFDRGAGKPNVQKGAFGQSLAQAISGEDTVFSVPPYISAALKFVTNG
jgi:putative ATP-dependent endonuclease of OLD family